MKTTTRPGFKAERLFVHSPSKDRLEISEPMDPEKFCTFRCDLRDPRKAPRRRRELFHSILIEITVALVVLSALLWTVGFFLR